MSRLTENMDAVELKAFKRSIVRMAKKPPRGRTLKEHCRIVYGNFAELFENETELIRLCDARIARWIRR